MRTKRSLFERMPNVVVGAGGKISLVYLARNSSEKSWRAPIGPLSSSTPRPLDRECREAAASQRVLAGGLAPASLVVSADGQDVYGIAASGQHLKHALFR